MDPSILSLFISAFLEKGLIFLILGAAVYVFYKKDETRRANDLIEREGLRVKLDDQEKKFEEYLQKDKEALIETNIQLKQILLDSSRAIENNTKMQARSNDVINCLIKEIQEFKKSELYKARNI